MPELPEVETIVRYLDPRLRGQKISNAWTNTPRLFRVGDNFRAFKKHLLEKTIKAILRRGKYMVFQLSDGSEFLLHLMMTGQLILNPKDRKHRHIRFLFTFADGSALGFFDIRKFGMILHRHAPTSLGPDALSILFDQFYKNIHSCAAPIKSVLLNQAIISGLGNIYADEALWYAGIRPNKKARALSKIETKTLHRAIKKILVAAIAAEGTSSRNYRKPDNSEGGYYQLRKVYQRTGESCAKKDGGVIKRIVVGQRATHFCPAHQK